MSVTPIHVPANACVASGKPTNGLHTRCLGQRAIAQLSDYTLTSLK